MIYCNALMLFAIILLIRSMIGAPRLFVRQNLMILAALLIPTVVNAFYMYGISPVTGYNFRHSRVQDLVVQRILRFMITMSICSLLRCLQIAD